MCPDEWGWFISEEIPYIEDLCIETKRKTNRYEYNDNKKIERFKLTTIREDNIDEPPIQTWFIGLDKRYDFGNVFATTISNVLLLCIGGICYEFNNKNKE